jgi:hypothetical protein
MDHDICINSNSFPAKSMDEACCLFKESLQGLLELNEGADRYVLYHDSTDDGPLEALLLAEDYSYADFKQALLVDDIELYSFLDELDDKSPALDFLPDETINDISQYHFYMPGYPDSKFPDVFGLAWFQPAILLSLPTSGQWDTPELIIARTGEGEYIDETLTLKNIARYEHGQQLFDEYHQVDISTVCPNCYLSDEFIQWYEQQTDENKYRVVGKLRLASAKAFDGGEPLFKTLSDGIREIRFSACSGGAIRILFKALAGGKQAILVGFIKKSDNEGYAFNIPKARELFGQIEAS